ncbi:diguanylate cyclase [Oxalobacteraceae bacterium]|nr:diguanylate cyclase [Oxalobacteraceae bacterium]
MQPPFPLNASAQPSVLHSARRLLRRLYRKVLLPAFALALLASMWAAARYQLGQEYDNSHQEAVLHSQSLARTLAEHSNHLLRQIDHAGQLFRLKFEESGGSLRLPEFSRPGGLLDSVLPSRQDLALALLDANGRIIDSQGGYFDPALGTGALFQNLAGAAAGELRIATPVVEPNTKKWQVQIALRLNRPGGAFAGALVMMIDPASFVQDYDRLNVEEQGAVILMNRDTGLSLLRVDDRLLISDTLDFQASSGSGAGSDELHLRQPFDQVERIYSSHDIPRYALIAVVGIARHNAMARFERLRLRYYGVAAVGSVLVLLFTTLLMQQSRRLRRSIHQANEAQRILRSAMDASLDAMFQFKAIREHGEIIDFLVTDVNERGAQLVGRSSAELLDRRITEVLPEVRDEGHMQRYIEVMRTGQAAEDEFELGFLPGGVRWLRHQVVPIKGGVAVTTRDISPRKLAELALRESEGRLRTIADTLPAMVAYIDADEVYRFHNLAYEREFSRAGQLVLGRTILETVGPARYAGLAPYVQRVLRGETITFEEEDSSDDDERCYEVVYIPQHGGEGEGGNVIGFHVMRQDITVQKREKQRLLKLSQIDALTGLTNRAGFLQKLHDSMLACRENDSLMAVMYMDIDHFKPVNDTYGHGVGDALLKAFSARLTSTMRVSDTVARLGGDEFTIIMERIAQESDAATLAAKIVQAMRVPFDLDGTVVSVSASIGLAFYSDEELSPAELLKQADTLLYQAKQGGRDTFRASRGRKVSMV